MRKMHIKNIDPKHIKKLAREAAAEIKRDIGIVPFAAIVGGLHKRLRAERSTIKGLMSSHNEHISPIVDEVFKETR